jgi:hypothetical protein
MQTDKDTDLSNLAKQISGLLAQINLKKRDVFLESFSNLTNRVSNDSSWRIRSALLPFLQLFLFNHSLLISSLDYIKIYEVPINLLSDSQTEVRELSSVCISSMLRSAPPSQIDYLKEKVLQLSRTPINKKRRQNKNEELDAQSKNNLIKRHGGVLGLSAIILSNPYDVPEWMPSLLSILGLEHSSDPSPISDTVKRTFAEFWKTHQDMWHLFQERFTSEQLDVIRELSGSPSYFV